MATDSSPIAGRLTCVEASSCLPERLWWGDGGMTNSVEKTRRWEGWVCSLLLLHLHVIVQHKQLCMTWILTTQIYCRFVANRSIGGELLHSAGRNAHPICWHKMACSP